MTTQREALQQCLEALRSTRVWTCRRLHQMSTRPKCDAAITAAEAALAQPAEVVDRAPGPASPDDDFGSRLAFMLEAVIVDPHGNFHAACRLLDEYKDAWEEVNPSPPTFMGEPMPPDRRARLVAALDARVDIPAPQAPQQTESTDIAAHIHAASLQSASSYQREHGGSTQQAPQPATAAGGGEPKGQTGGEE